MLLQILIVFVFPIVLLILASVQLGKGSGSKFQNIFQIVVYVMGIGAFVWIILDGNIIPINLFYTFLIVGYVFSLCLEINFLSKNETTRMDILVGLLMFAHVVFSIFFLGSLIPS